MNLIHVKHGEVVVGVGRLFLARSARTTACTGLSVGSECLQKTEPRLPDNPHTRLVSHLMIEDDGAREAKVGSGFVRLRGVCTCVGDGASVARTPGCSDAPHNEPLPFKSDH